MAEDRTESPMPSMTLSISRDDAHRMAEASRAINKRLRKLQHMPSDDMQTMASVPSDIQANNGELSPAAVFPSCDDESAISSRANEPLNVGRPLHELVVEAATSCGDALIGSFLSTLKERGSKPHVIQTSLLLFLDMDKSDKLSAAFQLLSHVAGGEPILPCKNEDDSTSTTVVISSHENDTSKLPSGLDHDGAITLFKCFLTAISSCIQSKEPSKSATKNIDLSGPPAKVRKQTEDASPNSPSQNIKAELKREIYDNLEIPRASPSFDSSMDTSIASLVSLPLDTLREIDEIASFASEKLMEFVKNKHEMKGRTLVSFESFGDWYNSNGFIVVPWLELMDLAKWDLTCKLAPEGKTNPSSKRRSHSPPLQRTHSTPDVHSTSVNFFVDDRKEEGARRTLVTFDFTGTINDGKYGHAAPLCINITEDNLVTLKSLVHRTGLFSRSPDDIIEILLKQSTKCYVGGKEYSILEKSDFGRCIRLLVPAGMSTSFSRSEMEQFSNYFMTIFGCYENKALGQNTVDAKELAVGFSVMCAGSKSVKLAAGFDLLDKSREGQIQQDQLSKYIRSYLTMLVGISLLSTTQELHKNISSTMETGMTTAVENGATWTLGHFKKSCGRESHSTFTFESFAQWYTEGGYNVAPWLELLDLKKLLALLDDPADNRKAVLESVPRGRGRVTVEQNSFGPPPPADVLFTFPLAKGRSLVVLREDATYVRSVVEKLGLLSINPNEMWDALYKRVKARPPPPIQPWRRVRKTGSGKSMDVDQATFVQCLEEIVTSGMKANGLLSPGITRPSGSSISQTIANFFQSFDLDQVDRVALNQLMGGLSLLCGGKKSTKLAFSFGLFDGRQDSKGVTKSIHPSLNGEELFLFLRSFLIVMFSCCRQSLDLSAEAVSRYISDTSQLVAEDVMGYQWHTRKRDRVDFDDFGEWYNEGGFETAPWLELLDLKKWVLIDLSKNDSCHGPVVTASGEQARDGMSYYCPPPPPEDSVDQSFFGDDYNALLPMDSIDEMDLLLMAQPSHDKENDGTFMPPSSPHPRSQCRGRPSNSLKFHLVTHEEQGGYMLAVSQKRVRHLRRVLTESGLHEMDAEDACRKILNKASRVNGKLVLKKGDFDSAIRSILAQSKPTREHMGESQRILAEMFSFLFSVFDRKKNGAPSAMEIACGFTVICKGKKSDKLEFAFDVLDDNRDGKLSRSEMTNYLRSFLTVLLSVSTCSYLAADSEDNFLLMSGKPFDLSCDSVATAAKAGSEWAANQAFKACFADGKSEEELSFDDFADWYTRKGFGSIPWLELLDLRKWVLTEM